MFYNEFKTPILRSTMDRDGEMSRLRAMTGLRISSSPSVSTYIIEKKIRNILKHYASQSSWTEVKRVDRMITKLDKLTAASLEYLHYLGTEESVADMIQTLQSTFKNINSTSRAWKETKGDTVELG